MAEWNIKDRLSAVPLFPLPNVVLFPRAILPLHIFEERYKAMTADAVKSNKLIAMALLKPGWERDYHCRPAMESVVCVGKILTHEQLADGKYNFLIQGMGRAGIVGETPRSDLLYRTADLQPLAETQVMEFDLIDRRRELISIFENRFRHTDGLVKQFRQMLASPMPTADIADLVAFNLFDNVRLKQSLLAEVDIIQRVRRVIASLEHLEEVSPPIAKSARVEDASLN